VSKCLKVKAKFHTKIAQRKTKKVVVTQKKIQKYKKILKTCSKAERKIIKKKIAKLQVKVKVCKKQVKKEKKVAKIARKNSKKVKVVSRVSKKTVVKKHSFRSQIVI
jgi:hypothetical protein